MKKNIKILLASALFFSSAAKADVNIAIITPMSGDYKYFSEELIDGAKTAVDEINNNGGLQGQKINLLLVDDPCDDALSLSTAQMMALNNTEDKVYLVLGPHCANSADSIASLFEQAKILQIHPVSISRGYYALPHPKVIKFTGYNDEQAKELYRFISSHYPQGKLAVIYNSDNLSMTAQAQAIAKEYGTQKSVDKVIMLPYNNTAPYTNALIAIRDSGASLAYIMGESREILEIANQLRSQNKNMVLFADRYQLNRKFAHEISELSKDGFVLSMPPLSSNPNFTSTAVKLRLWGIEPKGLMPYSYLTIKTWIDLVKHGKSFGYDTLIRDINNQNTDTGWDIVRYSGGVPSKFLPYIIYHVKNGEYTQVR